MKRILLCAAMLWIYRAEAQSPVGQPVTDQYPTVPGYYPPELAASVSGSGITNNVCDSLHAAFVHYPLYGLTVQFNTESSVIGGSIFFYSWHFGDTYSTSDSSNATNPSYTYTSVGTYTACLAVFEDVNGSGVTCEDTSCQTVVVTYVAGVQDLSDNAVNVYPNPSNGYLTVKSSIPVESYSIYSLVGEKLSEQLYTGDVIHLPPTMTNGIYFIYFKTSTTTLIKKLLLQYQ